MTYSKPLLFSIFCALLASCSYFDTDAAPQGDPAVEKINLMTGEEYRQGLSSAERAPDDLSEIVTRASGGSVIIYSLDDPAPVTQP